MKVVTLPEPLYQRIIDELTTPTDRLIHPDRGKRLPGGHVRYEMPDELVSALQAYMFEGESYADALERLVARAKGRVS